MEKEIEKLEEKLEDHERRIKILESLISSDNVPQKEVSREIQDVIKAFKELDLAEYEYVYGLSGLPLFIAIIHIARDELGIDGISPTEISQICKEKIRVLKGVDRTTIGGTLTAAGSKIDRIDNPRGRGFVYRVTRAGEQFLQEHVRQGKTT